MKKNYPIFHLQLCCPTKMDQSEQRPIYHCIKCNRKFNSINDYVAHSSQDYCTTITDLDDNCLDTIFKHLAYNDLASIKSLTCKLQALQTTGRTLFCHLTRIQKFSQSKLWPHLIRYNFIFVKKILMHTKKIFRSLIQSVFVTYNEIAREKKCF